MVIFLMFLFLVIYGSIIILEVEIIFCLKLLLIEWMKDNKIIDVDD